MQDAHGFSRFSLYRSKWSGRPENPKSDSFRSLGPAGLIPNTFRGMYFCTCIQRPLGASEVSDAHFVDSFSIYLGAFNKAEVHQVATLDFASVVFSLVSVVLL